MNDQAEDSTNRSAWQKMRASWTEATDSRRSINFYDDGTVLLDMGGADLNAPREVLVGKCVIRGGAAFAELHLDPDRSFRGVIDSSSQGEQLRAAANEEAKRAYNVTLTLNVEGDELRMKGDYTGHFFKVPTR